MELKPIFKKGIMSSLFDKTKTALAVAALFTAVAGRAGVYYGGSYEEILQENAKSLGAEIFQALLIP